MERVFAVNDSDDVVKEFLVESCENLDRLDRDLIALENNPNDREILASIFRTIHTIKGTSGFLAFNQLGAVTHVGESLLGRLLDGQHELDGEITSALLAMVDAVRQMLASMTRSWGSISAVMRRGKPWFALTLRLKIWTSFVSRSTLTAPWTRSQPR
jgi:two-component system chemotaxis sensor kinase CheA